MRRGQHDRSAMAEPRPGQTTFLIIVSPLPGKYELYKTELALAFLAKGSTGTVGAPPTFRQAANAPQAPQSLCQGHVRDMKDTVSSSQSRHFSLSLNHHVRVERERSSPLPEIVQSRFLHLRNPQGSARPECNGRASPWVNNLLDHCIAPARAVCVRPDRAGAGL